VDVRTSQRYIDQQTCGFARNLRGYVHTRSVLKSPDNVICIGQRETASHTAYFYEYVKPTMERNRDKKSETIHSTKPSTCPNREQSYACRMQRLNTTCGRHSSDEVAPSHSANHSTPPLHAQERGTISSSHSSGAASCENSL
jgi:hypothetical protein